MTFATFSTVLAVCEAILSCVRDLTNWSRPKASLICCVTVAVLSLPCALGFNVLSDFHPLGPGTVVLDLEDFIVSNILLPLGSLCFVLFWKSIPVKALRCPISCAFIARGFCR